MSAQKKRILVVEDVQETRDAIESLLWRVGYRTDPARDEQEAVERIRSNVPDAILLSLGGSAEMILNAAYRIRARGGLTESTPIVIFSITGLAEGEEKKIEGNIYVTLPDNFNQLRMLLARVLGGASRKH